MFELDAPLSFKEVFKAIKHLKTTKPPGPDGIPDLQLITSRFGSAARALACQPKKTEVLHQLIPGTIYDEPSVSSDGSRLKVNNFCYLGSIMRSSASLDMDVESRIRKACFAFGQLGD